MGGELESLFAEAQAYVDEFSGDFVSLVNDSKAKMGRLGNMLVHEHEHVTRGWGKYTADDRYLIRYMTTGTVDPIDIPLTAKELVWDTLETLWERYREEV